jgi:hypothetical protein
MRIEFQQRLPTVGEQKGHEWSGLCLGLLLQSPNRGVGVPSSLEPSPVAFNEQTSPVLGALAAALGQDPKPNVRRVAMSSLTQVPDHNPPRLQRLLDQLVATFTPEVGPGPHMNAQYEAAIEEALRHAPKNAMGLLGGFAPLGNAMRATEPPRPSRLAEVGLAAGRIEPAPRGMDLISELLREAYPNPPRR